MQANVHYDPDSTTTYTADKATVRLLLAIAATFELQLDHLDITAAYLHEKFAQTGTEKVYVKQFARFDGSIKHSATAGILDGNLYGGPNGGIHVSQPAAIQTLIGKTNMSKANGKHTPYVDGSNLHPVKKTKRRPLSAPKSLNKYLASCGTSPTRPGQIYTMPQSASAVQQKTQQSAIGMG